MKTTFSIIIVSGLCLFCSRAFSQEKIDPSDPFYVAPVAEESKKIIKEAQENPERYKQYTNRMKGSVQTSVRNIAFHGKVVDFNGNPVSGAVVALSVRKYDPAAEYFMNSQEPELTTDSKGIFRYKGS